jgi:NADH:ubiquinone oxidoreductase subunit 3 (subunit A)
MSDITDVLLGPAIIAAADLAVFYLVSRLGKRSTGKGAKFSPFSGGEESVPVRGIYQSNLFVFAALFLVTEAFALLLAGSYEAPGSYYPMLFLLGGGSIVTITTWWYINVGGGEF